MLYFSLIYLLNSTPHPISLKSPGNVKNYCLMTFIYTWELTIINVITHELHSQGCHAFKGIDSLSGPYHPWTFQTAALAWSVVGHWTGEI